jgi:hypothetical protein
MRYLMRGGLGLALVAVGYFLGSTGVLQSPPAHAQVQPGEDPLNKDTKVKIKTAYEALMAAKEALANDGRYIPATDPTVLNAFGVLSGGLNAVNDLESGQGVDPETFAALYADFAAGNLREDIARDAQGRLTYKNKVIRMYPIARLKQEFARRRELAGIEDK